jgi:hypothetical protein
MKYAFCCEIPARTQRVALDDVVVRRRAGHRHVVEYCAVPVRVVTSVRRLSGTYRLLLSEVVLWEFCAVNTTR